MTKFAHKKNWKENFLTCAKLTQNKTNKVFASEPFSAYLLSRTEILSPDHNGFMPEKTLWVPIAKKAELWKSGKRAQNL